MSEINKNQRTLACDLGALLETRDAKLIRLVAGDTQLAVHRSVLVAKCPVFAAMLGHDTLEASSRRIDITDTEPEVLKQLVLFMYKDSAPQLCSMAPQLLVVADKYCVKELKAQCELQLIQDLSVKNIMKSASIAVRHSCLRLKKVAECFLLSNITKVMASDSWAEAVLSHPEEFIEVSHLLSTGRKVSREEANQELVTEIKGWCPDEVRKLLARGADVGARDESGRTALHHAAANGSTSITELLLQAGARLEARDLLLQTPLYAAVQANSVDIVKQLVAASSEVNTADLYGDTPLHLAAQLGRREMVQTLLHLGADKGARSAERETPTSVAERCRRMDLLDMLSDSGSAKKSEINKNPETPACDLEALLEARDAALVRLVAGETQLAVHRSVLVAKSPVFAAMLGHDTLEASSRRINITDTEPEVLKQLVLFMYKDSAPQLCSMAPQLLVAADKYCVKELKAQCELQLVEDLSVENVVTSALLAMRHSCPRLKEIAVCFLKANLATVMGSNGWTSAVLLSPEEFMELSRLIAATPARNRNGSQEELDKKLLKAAEGSMFTEVQQLLTSGANVGARNESGKTVLHYATAGTYREIIGQLLSAGAPVNARDRWLQTPLYAAIQRNRCRVVKQLLEASSDVNTPDVYGCTPLHLAAQWSTGDTVQALLDAGADRGAVNYRMERPMDVAERFKKQHLVSMLG